MGQSHVSRRSAVQGILVGGMALPLLAACGSAGTKTTAPTGPLTKTADIPVGGGRIFKNEEVVITQPSAGEYKALSAVCTHQGCIVSTISHGAINCGCHGSEFSIKDGAVLRGPATQPLPPVKFSVGGGEISLT